MEYRNFTKDNIKVSALGFGCMRFPILDNDSSKIDEEKSIEMIRHAIDKGVNYIDTAYPYHQENSEYLVGKALKNGYREKVYLATKSPSWLIETYDDFHKYLDEQLEKLNVEYIDFYLLHTLNKDYWENLKSLDVLKFIDEAKKTGKIKYIGFSFHDEIDVFKEIIDYHDWDFCQIQYNYLDENYQAGKEGLEYAYEKGISVVIMEPIKGGKLVNASDEIKDIWKLSETKRTPAEWALRWVLNHKEVSVVLSGMNNLEEVKENIETASHAKANHLDENEIKLIDRVKKIYQNKIKVGCTSCEYCLPCPEGVSIPNIFEVYNDLYVFGTKEISKKRYESYIRREIDASKCIECGKCESMCPQNIQIIKALKEADKVLREDIIEENKENVKEKILKEKILKLKDLAGKIKFKDTSKEGQLKLEIVKVLDDFSRVLSEFIEKQRELEKHLDFLDLDLLKVELEIYGINQESDKKSNNGISPREAFSIYLEKYPQGKLRKIKLDKDKKELYYKIKAYDKENKYKIKINFENGKIIEEKSKARSNNKDYKEITIEDMEKVEKLIKLSLEDAGNKATLKEWSLKEKNDKIELEIEIEKKGVGEYEYEYDLETGNLLEFEKDLR